MLKSLFTSRRTTADVMTQFNQTLADLREVEREQSEAADAAAVEIALAQAAMSAAKDEAAQARGVAQRLEALIGGAAAAQEGFVAIASPN